MLMAECKRGFYPQVSNLECFHARGGRSPNTLSKKNSAHEEIKSISLQAIEFQSATAVAGNKIWRIKLCAERMIFPPVSGRSQSSDIFSSTVITQFPPKVKSPSLLCLIASIHRGSRRRERRREIERECYRCWKEGGYAFHLDSLHATQWKLPFWSTATTKQPTRGSLQPPSMVGGQCT